MRRRFLAIAASVLLLCLTLPPAHLASAAPLARGTARAPFQATVTRVVLTPSIKPAGSAGWVPAHVRDHLKAGDFASTDGKSLATLLFRDGMRLDMNHNTDVIIKDVRDVHLSTGELYERVPAGLGKRNVNTGSAVASVEGTKFDVRVVGNRTILTVIEHKVRFHNRYGSVLVHANQQSTVVGNHAPTAPVTVDASKVVAWAGSTGYSPQLAFPPYFFTAARRAAVAAAARRALRSGGTAGYLARLHLGQAAADESQPSVALGYFRQALGLRPTSLEALLGEARELLISGQLAAAGRAYGLARLLAPGAGAPLAGQGNVALLGGDVDRAVARYTAAEHLAPADATIPFWLGQALTVQGLYSAALAQEQRALRLAPRLAPAAVALGDVYSLMDQAAQAVAAYRHALAVDSRLWVAWNDLGIGLYALGRADEAIAALTHAVSVATTPYQRALSLGSLATDTSALGRVAEALRFAEQATQADPTNATAFVALGDLYDHDLGDYARAEKALRTALRLQPQGASAWATLGDVYFNAGAYGPALAAERRAIALAPSYIFPRTVLGAIYHAQGDERNAVAAYRAAVAAAPQSPDAWNAYGVGLHNAYRETEARDAFLHALQIVAPGSPSSATTYGYLASYYMSIPDAAAAVAAGKKGVALNPQDDIALSGLAYALLLTGDYQGAVPLYQRAVALNPHEASHWQFLAQAYRLLGKNSAGLAAARRAVALAPHRADVWYELGKERQSLLDMSGAITAYQRSISLDASYLDPRMELGRLYYLQGKWSQSASVLLKVVALNPADTGSWAYIGISYYNLKRYDLALGALKHAAADPKDPVSRSYLIVTYLFKHDYKNALTWSTELRTINAAQGEFYLGFTYQTMGGHDAQALAHLRRALTLAQQSQDQQVVAQAQGALAKLTKK